MVINAFAPSLGSTEVLPNFANISTPVHIPLPKPLAGTLTKRVFITKKAEESGSFHAVFGVIPS